MDVRLKPPICVGGLQVLKAALLRVVVQRSECHAGGGPGGAGGGARGSSLYNHHKLKPSLLAPDPITIKIMDLLGATELFHKTRS